MEITKSAEVSKCEKKAPLDRTKDVLEARVCEMRCYSA